MNHPGNRPGNGGQRGFTLIELMIALLISSLLVGMILAIFSRMSLAYRGQQQIAGVQQVLAAARAMIELDAKQAGLGMAQGFTTNIDLSKKLSPVQVFDSNTGPDQIRFFYADTSIQAVVSDPKDQNDWPNSLKVKPAPGPFLGDPDFVTLFAPGDLIVISTPNTTVPSLLAGTPEASPFGEANITQYTACVVRISPAPDSVTLGSPDD